MSGDEQSHLEVILEDMNGKVDLILEGHVRLEHMIHEHRTETRQNNRELQTLIKHLMTASMPRLAKYPTS